MDVLPMLTQNDSVIGTGEWEDHQCVQFKNDIQVGDIVCVRDGNKPLALCKVTSNAFKDPSLQGKFVHENYRKVKVLEYYTAEEKFPQPQGTLQSAINSNTPTWQFINAWYKSFIQAAAMRDARSLLETKGQIILQGPPGTGKTRLAKDIAESIICGFVNEDKKEQANNLKSKADQFRLIQFHPSYSYEDFVRGIAAKTVDGGISYEVEEKSLAQLARKALNNTQASKEGKSVQILDKGPQSVWSQFCEEIKNKLEVNTKVELSDSVWITAVETDRFRYRGNWKSEYDPSLKFSDIEQGIINNASTPQAFMKLNDISRTALDSASATYYTRIIDLFRKFAGEDYQPIAHNVDVQEQNFVLIIDEINRANLPAVFGELIYALEYRGEPVNDMYSKDETDQLILPKNLFILGTMNTADRSVGHIDYALRRRFSFVSVLPQENVIKNDWGRNLFNRVSELFLEKYLNPDFHKDQVQLGHSYFMADNAEKLQTRLQYEIKPILREYVSDGILKKEAEKFIEALTVQ